MIGERSLPNRRELTRRTVGAASVLSTAGAGFRAWGNPRHQSTAGIKLQKPLLYFNDDANVFRPAPYNENARLRQTPILATDGWSPV